MVLSLSISGCSTSTIRSKQFFIDSDCCHQTNCVLGKDGMSLINFPRNTETSVEKDFCEVVRNLIQHIQRSLVCQHADLWRTSEKNSEYFFRHYNRQQSMFITIHFNFLTLDHHSRSWVRYSGISFFFPLSSSANSRNLNLKQCWIIR